ncbi:MULTISPECIES: fatty acyl-AMP ligase [Streptomyces]|uniref:fatty acyl-AMP ligase n=1 Tax=Streptomyces TaxID=1883 RepID=UPI0036D0FF4E
MSRTAIAGDTVAIHQVLAHWAETTPTALAFAFYDDDLVEVDRATYADLYRRAGRVAAALSAEHPRGAHVLILLPPGLDYIVAIYGCFMAGMVAVSAAPPTPAQFDRALPRLKSIVNSADAQVVLSSRSLGEVAGKFATLERRGTPVPWIDFEGLPAVPADPVPCGPDDLAFLQYTSGSTAEPRGVMLSHRNLMVNCAAISANFGTSSDTVCFSWLPPYHDMGLIGTILHPTLIGAPCHAISPVTAIRRPMRWLQAMSRFKAEFSGGPNFMYDLCVRRHKHSDLAGLDLSHWRVAANGAEQVRPTTLRAFTEAFGPIGFRPEAFSPAYGMAETTLLLTTNGPVGATVAFFDEAGLRQGKAVPGQGVLLAGSGRVIEGHRVVVVDPDTGELCADDTIGEVWATGPSVAGGYWEAPEATGATFGARLAGGEDDSPYLRTGDLGFLMDGELFITGRRKELIIINGANHHPHDIEAAAEDGESLLRTHCSAAFALEREGEARLGLVMEAAAGEHDLAVLQQVMAGVRARVAAAGGPRVDSLVLVPPRAVPKTTSGKIQRLRCRDMLLAGDLAIIGEWHAAKANDIATAGRG